MNLELRSWRGNFLHKNPNSRNQVKEGEQICCLLWVLPDITLMSRLLETFWLKIKILAVVGEVLTVKLSNKLESRRAMAKKTKFWMIPEISTCPSGDRRKFTGRIAFSCWDNMLWVLSLNDLIRNLFWVIFDRVKHIMCQVYRLNWFWASSPQLICSVYTLIHLNPTATSACIHHQPFGLAEAPGNWVEDFYWICWNSRLPERISKFITTISEFFLKGIDEL